VEAFCELCGVPPLVRLIQNARPPLSVLAAGVLNMVASSSAASRDYLRQQMQCLRPLLRLFRIVNSEGDHAMTVELGRLLKSLRTKGEG
jgi:hypothetical protein